jgi:anti-anti-sigma factor
MYSRQAFASRFEIDDASRVVVVVLTGHFDPMAADELHPQIQELIGAGFRRFVFDLAGLDYVGSLGLRLFLAVHNQVKADGAVALCQLTGPVQSVLDVTKLHQVLRTYPTRADAVDAVKGR